MEVDCKIVKEFESNKLSNKKYDEIYNYALKIRDHKNVVSKEVNDHLLDYLDISKPSFTKLMRAKYYHFIDSKFEECLYVDVYKSYVNKFESIKRNIKFETTKYLGINYYERSTTNVNKGDFKSYNISRTSTDLSVTLTYLARYGFDNTVNYLNNQLLTCDSKKKIFLNKLLNTINKFGFDRLYKLALSKRERVMIKHSKIAIVFKSLTFGGRTRVGKFIGYNTKYNSLIKVFMKLSWLDKTKLIIPIKYAKSYHGGFVDYAKPHVKVDNDHQYILMFDEKNKEIKINICKDEKRIHPDHKTNYIGIDVNVKTNLFYLSDGKPFTYKRYLVDAHIELCKELDELKKDKNYRIGKRKQRKIDKLKEKMLKYVQRIIVDVCKYLNKNEYDHVVLENLTNSFGKSFITKDNINFNRIVSFLGLGSIKDEFVHIARNYDICVSFVHPEFTSQTCPECGHIDKGNRKTQANFICLDCGHTDNADHVGSVNIKERVLSTVLRGLLLDQKIDDGTFRPKNLPRGKVIQVLNSLRVNGQKP